MKLTDDDFTLFGLPRRQRLDRGDLDARRRELQAQVHPDRFAHEGAAAQRVAMQWAVRVNEAWQRLKDPVRRGAYLCELAGVPVNAERHTAMPPEFLVQQMAWREALEDAAGAADPAALNALDAEVAAEERLLHERLAATLDDAGDVAAAAQIVRTLMFVSKFRDDLAGALDRHERA